MAVTDTLLNTLFDGRYRILRKLGSGGMANVYLAQDQELGRSVAIKILNDRHAADEQFVERFRREAKSAASLSHPNIVSIYDRGEAEGTYYIAMEHLDGRNLKELIVARGPAPVQVAVDYARQILAALRFAHRNGIVHRDIKPHNILVDSESRVKVTDFGIARAGGRTQVTEAGSIVGTAQYLSPEQARGGPVDRRSDLYSLGIVLYELLTGTVPFTGDTPVEIAMKHLAEVPPPPSSRRRDIPRDLDLIVMRALAKDPEERYESAEEMDRDLDRFARGVALSAETAEAATGIISGASSMPTTISRAPTAVRTDATTAKPTATRPYTAAPAPPPPVMYDYDERRARRRPFWPWLLALLLAVAAIVGGWYAYDQIQEQLNETRPVAVPLVSGRTKELAKRALGERGLKWSISYDFSEDVPVGHVISQEPDAGDRIERGNTVSMVVSYGRKRVEVPDVRGDPATDAVAALAEAGLKARPVYINSSKPEGTVTAQDPRPGTRVRQATVVRVNVSRGPAPVGVPAVEGQPFETANAQLQAAGFSVARRDVDSAQPRGIVVDQEPGGNSTAPKGSTVTLYISKGPETTAVPSVEGLDRGTAVATIRNSGFRARVLERDTDDPTLRGLVLGQDPEGGAQAKPGATVTITVGRYVAPPPADTEPAQPQQPPDDDGTLPLP